MITYNDLYETLRKEKYSENLQPLNKKFISDVSNYLEEKKQASDKKEDLFSDDLIKTKKQLENAVAIFRELMLRRKRKLLTLALVARETGLSKRDFDNMLSFEKELFDVIVKGMEEADKGIEKLLRGEAKEKTGHVLVNFLQNTEELLGLDGEMIGPFDKGDMANLPEDVAKILVEGKKVEIVDE